MFFFVKKKVQKNGLERDAEAHVGHGCSSSRLACSSRPQSGHAPDVCSLSGMTLHPQLCSENTLRLNVIALYFYIQYIYLYLVNHI